MATVARCPRADRIAGIAKNAERAFAEHQIVQELDAGMYRAWRCKKPDSGTYAFSVITTPGRLIVAGDVGFLALERTEDMVAWARGAINSIGYFEEKVPHGFQTREFDPALAKAWIQERLAENDEPTPEQVEWLAENVDRDWQGEHEFLAELWEHRLVDESPDVTTYTGRFLWCREALKWFLDHWPA